MEIQLANKLGVSRTPIREAIRKLELEGLVLMIPRKGAEVAEITEKSLRDVLEIRQVLEQLAVRLACDRMEEEDLQKLRDAAYDFDQIMPSDDITRMAESDVAFHDIIYNATDNQKLVGLLSNIREQMYRYRIEYLKQPNSQYQIHEEHVKLIKALEQRDSELAATISIEHIENQVKQVAEAINQSNH